MLVIAVFIVYLVGAVFSSSIFSSVNDCWFGPSKDKECTWFVVEDDQYVGMKWKIATNETDMMGRGPHKPEENSFNFLHIEGVKWKNETKDKFRSTNFRSPMLKPIKNGCLNIFYWSNLENEKDEVILYQKVPGSRTGKTLLHVQGNTDKFWKLARVDISSNENFQLTFIERSYGRGKNIPDFAISMMEFWHTKCDAKEVHYDNINIPDIKYKGFDNLKEDEVLPNVFRVDCYKDKREGSTDTFPFRKTINISRSMGRLKSEAFMVSKCYNYLKDLMYINTYFAIRGTTCFFGPDRDVKYDKHGRSTGCKLYPFDIKPGSIFVYTWNV